MSYSFNVAAATKEEAKAAVKAKLDEVTALQPSHAKNQAADYGVACAMIDQLKDDPDGAFNVFVTMNGNVGWNWNAEDENDPNKIELTSASVGVAAHYVNR